MVNMEGEIQKKYSEPPPMSRKNQRCPSTALHIPYPPRRTSPLCNGGGERGGSPWRCPRTTLQVAYPPLKKTTIRVMGGGKGVFAVALHKHGTARRLLSPTSPPPPPRVWDIYKLKMRLTSIFGGVDKDSTAEAAAAAEAAAEASAAKASASAEAVKAGKQ